MCIVFTHKQYEKKLSRQKSKSFGRTLKRAFNKVEIIIRKLVLLHRHNCSEKKLQHILLFDTVLYYLGNKLIGSRREIYCLDISCIYVWFTTAQIVIKKNKRMANQPIYR